MFRLQNNTPPYFISNSRDFQLICRLYDCINNGVKFDIDTIPNILSAYKTNNRILKLLATRLGFFTNKDLDENALRVILDAFPYIMKYKGSKKGILLAVNTILRLEKFNEVPQIVINNVVDGEPIFDITIYTNQVIKNKDALLELLSYIIPAGYTYSIKEYSSEQESITLSTSSIAYTLVNPTISSSQVRGSDRVLNSIDIEDNKGSNDFNYTSKVQDNYIATIDTTQVIGSGSSDDTLSNLTTNTYASDRNGVMRDEIDSSTLVKETEEK